MTTASSCRSFLLLVLAGPLTGCLSPSGTEMHFYVENETDRPLSVRFHVNGEMVWEAEVAPGPMARVESPAVPVESRFVRIVVEDSVSGRRASEVEWAGSETHVLATFASLLRLRVYDAPPLGG